MSNQLKNGTVLPSGLLGHNPNAIAAAFNKTYKSTALRVGVVIDSYVVGSPKNLSGLATEYDVSCMEQNENRGTTTTTYKNCMLASGLGSIADFFEKTLRVREKRTDKGEATRPNDQNGSLALILCLDGIVDRAVVIACFPHPDRKTTLTTEDPRLEGEYNGINIKVESDGSTTLTFRGATDNYGKVKDSTQGNTVVSIEKDGSFQTKHKTITQRLDKNGKASLTADDDISNTTKKNFNATATEGINLTAKKDLVTSSDKLTMTAQGSANIQCQSATIKADSAITLNGSEFKVEAASMANIKAASIVLDGIVSLGGQGGQPVLLMSTVIIGTGNLGLPVVSQAISGFATKVTAQ